MMDRPKFRKKYKYTVHITRFFIVSALICLAGGAFTLKGLVNLYNRGHVWTFYDPEKIHSGNYVRYDISRDQILGRFYTDADGEDKYGPLCVVDAWTSEYRYMAASDDSKHVYLSLNVSDRLQPQLQKLVDGETNTYQIYGKVRKLRYDLQYDRIAEYMDISDLDELKQIVSAKHEIKVVDPERRESMWYKGLIFFVMGFCGVLRGVEKKEV